MVQSSIIVPPTSTRKRSIDGSDTPSEESKRPRVESSEDQQKRNRRLFGTLLGTLNKFKDETEKMSDIEKKRQAINEKMHEKLEAERKLERERLEARKAERIKMQEEKAKVYQAKLAKEKKLAEDKLELSKLIENEKLSNFLKTNTAPALYYLPSTLTEDMKNVIREQKEKALEARKDFETRMEVGDVKPRRGEVKEDDDEEEEEEYDGEDDRSERRGVE